jgi:hypothetical protein
MVCALDAMPILAGTLSAWSLNRLCGTQLQISLATGQRQARLHTCGSRVCLSRYSYSCSFINPPMGCLFTIGAVLPQRVERARR